VVGRSMIEAESDVAKRPRVNPRTPTRVAYALMTRSAWIVCQQANEKPRRPPVY
jgi:hypothetical protein